MMNQAQTVGLNQFAAAYTGYCASRDEWELAYKMSFTSLAYKHTFVYKCRNM